MDGKMDKGLNSDGVDKVALADLWVSSTQDGEGKEG